MNMKVRKSVIAFLMATTMVGSTAVPAMADTVTAKVSIKTTGLTGKKSASPDIVPEKVVTVTNSNGSVTALDVLKAVSGSDTETKETLNGKTYHYQGVLSWCDSQYGNYIPAVKMENHANSDLGKVFADDGTANKTANSLANGREKYFKLSNLNTTETESMKVTKNSTWNNIVHKTDWLSEKDYNNYSGWMTIIDGNTDNLGVDTVLSDTKEHTVCLDFSMMMGLDLGFSSYVQQGDQWIQVPGWK